METMDTNVRVFEHDAGSSDPEVRQKWRAYRQAAYRLGFKEREGKLHPASKNDKAIKAIDTEVEETIELPRGMGWNDFGVTWDLHPEHPEISVLRKVSVAEQWERAIEEDGS